MSTARIVVDRGVADVFSPFEVRDLVKSFPGRRWDPTRKCWQVGALFVDQLADAMRAAGVTVFVTRKDGTAWSSGRQAHGHRATPAVGWAKALHDAVGEQHRDRVFKALVRVLHPDAGGDNRLMQELNDAFRRSA